jgi:hypothetical protein
MLKELMLKSNIEAFKKDVDAFIEENGPLFITAALEGRYYIRLKGLEGWVFRPTEVKHPIYGELLVQMSCEEKIEISWDKGVTTPYKD